jgi:hypothetical protein
MGPSASGVLFSSRVYVSAGTRDHPSQRPWALLARALTVLLCATATQTFAAEQQVIKEPEIISRQAWGALPAKPELMQEQKPAEIILHHTGARQQPNVGLDVKLRGLQGFSMTAGRVGLLSKPAWGDVLYHYYIDVLGKIGEGRDVNFAGDSATDFDNDDRIQIVLEGDFEHEQPAKAQLDTLMKLVTWLALKYGVPAENISGHGDHEATDCPGRNLRPFLEDLKKAVQAEYATVVK